MNQTEETKLLEQIEKWNDADEFSRCIEAIEMCIRDRDLDVEVSRLKLMKADHQSKQYRLEDQLLKYFPEEIEKHKGFIKGFESDLEVLAAHPHPEDGFAGMEIRGDLLTDKENAGAALLDACKEVKTSDPVQIGSYRGYARVKIRMFIPFFCCYAKRFRTIFVSLHPLKEFRSKNIKILYGNEFKYAPISVRS